MCNLNKNKNNKLMKKNKKRFSYFNLFTCCISQQHPNNNNNKHNDDDDDEKEDLEDLFISSSVSTSTQLFEEEISYQIEIQNALLYLGNVLEKVVTRPELINPEIPTKIIPLQCNNKRFSLTLLRNGGFKLKPCYSDNKSVQSESNRILFESKIIQTFHPYPDAVNVIPAVAAAETDFAKDIKILKDDVGVLKKFLFHMEPSLQIERGNLFGITIKNTNFNDDHNYKLVEAKTRARNYVKFHKLINIDYRKRGNLLKNNKRNNINKIELNCKSAI